MNSKQEQYPDENQQKTYCHRLISLCFYTNAIVIIFLSIYFLLLPAGLMIYYINDPGLKESRMPKFAYSLHKSLSRRYEKWARGRVASEKATELNVNDISGTEWPVFGSVFYLWATESLQEAWQKDNNYSSVAPNVYAKGAIEAAAALIVDPGHATWVKEHWGENYLYRENLFYRMLLISGMTSYQKLLKDDKYQTFLEKQVKTFSKEIDESPYGLLDDYPGQCYPVDVIAAIAAIKRADNVLGTDHSDFAKRSVRAFEDDRLDKNTRLPAYVCYAESGCGDDSARGVGISFMLIWAPELWEEVAEQWYSNYEEYFWESSSFLSGFREFSNNISGKEWMFEVDAGPVVKGYGTAACAFGIGAARANGRFDHAYPLAAELIVASMPLIDGTLLTPRMLSNSTDAPYLGEASNLFLLTRMPVDGVDIVTDGYMPTIVYIVISFLFIMVFVITVSLIVSVKKFYKSNSLNLKVIMPKVQFLIWCILIVTACIYYFKVNLSFTILLLFLAQVFPRYKIIK